MVEEKRIAARNKAVRMFLIVSAVLLTPFLLFTGWAYYSFQDISIIFVILIVTVIVLRAVWSQSIDYDSYKEYKKTYKAYFVPSVLSRFFEDCKYDQSRGIDFQTVSDANYLRMDITFNSNDYIAGTYKKTKFIQADLNFGKNLKKRDIRGSNHYRFYGRYIVIKFNKNFSHRLEIIGNGFSMANIPKGKDNKELKEVSLESPGLSKKARIYAEEEFEAFYLLDPAFLSNIEALFDMYDNRVLLGFYDDCIHIAIMNNRDSLEPPSLFRKINEEAEISRISSEFSSITSIIDSLKIRN